MPVPLLQTQLEIFSAKRATVAAVVATVCFSHSILSAEALSRYVAAVEKYLNAAMTSHAALAETSLAMFATAACNRSETAAAPCSQGAVEKCAAWPGR
mmetsp:Transcript_10024/g.16130  ORF Transcript_10024/g.16130 Transcript_10024/m.16130 type:complete len:98 (+) Transcript_10024:2110-2403(+)